jgi:hypothetical protein
MFKNKFDERYAKKKKMSITVVFSPDLYNSELFAFRLLLKKKHIMMQRSYFFDICSVGGF